MELAPSDRDFHHFVCRSEPCETLIDNTFTDVFDITVSKLSQLQREFWSLTSLKSSIFSNGLPQPSLA